MTAFRLLPCGLFSRNLLQKRSIVLLLLPVLVFSLVCSTCQLLPQPPGQPSSGPGGAEYRHEAVNISEYGQEENQYWIFEPASPIPESAPLIVLNHGWLAMNPQSYGAWIDHLVGRGNIVVYPRYQIANTPPEETTQNAITAVKDAIEHLQDEGHVTPQLERFAIVGHSLGGSITANMAALAVSAGLPEPEAILFAEPGDGSNIGAHILTTDLSTISSEALMVVVVASGDTVAGDTIGKRIFEQTPQIPAANKNFVSMFSDYYGYPPLVADHFTPVCPDDRYDVEGFNFQSLVRRIIQECLGATVNAMDYYGFWKLFDGLTDAAFYGENIEYALGNTPEQRFMGEWSDGTPVKELEVIQYP